jgi:DNA primase
VRYCAEIFSNGDSRLVPLLAENLITQVRRQRRATSGGAQQPVTNSPKPWKTTSLEQAEAALLRVFLHAPVYRAEVCHVLETRDLQFSYSHHRALWRQMQGMLSPFPALDPSEDPIDLVSLLRNQIAESEGNNSHLQALMTLNEKTKRDILRAPLVIRAAAACMEKNLCEKRYRHFLNLWSQADFKTSSEQMAYFQSQIYAEKRRIEELEKDRQATFEDLVHIPWVGEFYDTIDS